MTNRIAVHLEGQEGAIQIDALDGRVLTPADERPEWAEGYAVALLGERIGWFEQRLGKQLPDNIRKPDLMLANTLGWVAVDAEGSEVEVEADTDARMDVLAQLLDIDREDYDQERNFKNVLASAEVSHTYTTQPTNEATLAELEGQTFSDAEKKAING